MIKEEKNINAMYLLIHIIVLQVKPQCCFNEAHESVEKPASLPYNEFKPSC